MRKKFCLRRSLWYVSPPVLVGGAKQLIELAVFLILKQMHNSSNTYLQNDSHGFAKVDRMKGPKVSFEQFKKRILKDNQCELELLNMEVKEREEMLWNIFLFGYSFVQYFFTHAKNTN